MSGATHWIPLPMLQEEHETACPTRKSGDKKLCTCVSPTGSMWLRQENGECSAECGAHGVVYQPLDEEGGPGPACADCLEKFCGGRPEELWVCMACGREGVSRQQLLSRDTSCGMHAVRVDPMSVERYAGRVIKATAIGAD